MSRRSCFIISCNDQLSGDLKQLETPAEMQEVTEVTMTTLMVTMATLKVTITTLIVTMATV